MTAPNAKPDAIENLRRLLAREPMSERDATFAAAILEICDRLDALANSTLPRTGKSRRWRNSASTCRGRFSSCWLCSY
jgi:hypothetical protein